LYQQYQSDEKIDDIECSGKLEMSGLGKLEMSGFAK